MVKQFDTTNHVVRRIELNPGSEASLDTLREQGKTDLAPPSAESLFRRDEND